MKRMYLSLFLCLISVVFVSAQKAEKKMLSGTYTKEILEQSLCMPQTFSSVPRAGTPFWKDSVPDHMRKSYIQLGETYLHKPWEVLPASVFSEFKTIGNRVNYEQISFARRRQFVALVMAEIMEGNGRFMPDIINGAWALCEETWWGIPAHYGTKLPLTEDQNVDLFNAESAGMMAWANYMLKTQFDSFSPLISQRINKEIDRRFLTPCLEVNFGWKTNTSNWNPWICSNWTTCVLLCEQDRTRQLKAIEMILKSLDCYIDAAPEDGGCDEGPSYWTRAAGSLSENLILLKQATGGVIDLSQQKKVQALGSFLYKTYIGNGFAVNFADASVHASSEVNVVFPFATYIDDEVMQQYATLVAQKSGFMEDPATLFNEAGNYPSLGHELRLLGQLKSVQQTTPNEPLISDSWLPDLQVMTSRSVKGSTDGLYLAAKGGHNAESHNHNDVGSYVVYYNAQPLLIDVGVGTYTSQTFGKERYDIWAMQSGYHNLPKINGVDQKDGRQYKANDLAYTAKGNKVTFSLDIAAAYPQEAAVESWKRTFVFTKNKQITITENYRLKAYKAPTEIVLMTCCKPTLTDKGIVLKTTEGDRMLLFDQSLTPFIEYKEITDARLLTSWKPDMWRIRLKIQSTALKGKVSYTIQ